MRDKKKKGLAATRPKKLTPKSKSELKDKIGRNGTRVKLEDSRPLINRTLSGLFFWEKDK